jgi:inner membrane protein
MLIFFYGFVYVLLQLQDYSLLLGNIALFLILAAIMFFTRKINWFEVLKGKTA